MKNFFFIIPFLFISSISLMYSQKGGIQFGLVYPLSINGAKSFECDNYASINLLGDISKNEKGITISGITSLIKNDAFGLQIAGVSNHINNNAKSMTIAGVGNFTKNNHTGLQISGLINKANEMNGVQIAGLINYAKKAKGIQISGFVNIAEESNFPLAPINLIKNGEKSITISYNNLEMIKATFLSGGKWSYGEIGFLYNSTHSDTFSYFGLGLQVPMSNKIGIKGSVFIQNDINKIEKPEIVISGAKITPNVTLFKGVYLFADLGINYISINSDNFKYVLVNNPIKEKISDSKTEQMQFTYSGGIGFKL